MALEEHAAFSKKKLSNDQKFEEQDFAEEKERI
jgi:hypothetical protein